MPCSARWFWLALLLLIALPGRSQPWTDDAHHLTMTPPEQWMEMPGVVLDEARRSVRHITGEGYRGGYQFHDAQVLLFPYVLLQYTPYTTLPDAQRPTHQLDETGALQLIARLVPTFRAPDPLPAGINAAAFTEQTRSEMLSLARFEPDGRFELTGRIPFAEGDGAIAYHTVGRLGRDGVAFATVFTDEDLALLMPVVERSLRTLAFTDGYGYTGLPEDAPDVAGFLPPVAEPLSADALRMGDGVFGLVPADDFSPLSAGALRRDDPLLLAAVPQTLREGLVLEAVLTRTPSSTRLTTPWAAAGFIPWARWGLEAAPARRPGLAAWAEVVAQALGREPGEVRAHLERYVSADSEFVPMLGTEGADDPMGWRLEAADVARGRFVLVQRFPDPVDPRFRFRRVLALQGGASGVALFVTQGYDDADWSAQTAMAESIRFIGGERLVDLPPAESAGGLAAQSPPDAGPGAQQPDTPEPAAGAGGSARGSTAEPPAEAADDPGGSLALPLVIGGLVLVFVVIAVLVVISSHRQATRRREKARARRERLAERETPQARASRPAEPRERGR
jgi:hypothetical protein